MTYTADGQRGVKSDVITKLTVTHCFATLTDTIENYGSKYLVAIF